MGGREKIYVFYYDAEGKFIKKFESLSDFARETGYQTNVFINSGYNKETVQLKDGNFASTIRIGRDGIRELKKYLNNEYVGHGKALAKGKAKANNENYRILVYDLDGDLIATFENKFIAVKFGIDGRHINYEGNYISKGFTIKLEEK